MDLDIQDPPTVHLYEERLDEVSSAVTSSARFALNFPKIHISVNNNHDGSVLVAVNVAMSAEAKITCTDSKMTIRLIDANIKTDNSTLQELLGVVVDAIVGYIILLQITLPSISFEHLHLALPVPVVQNSFILGYSSLGRGRTTTTLPNRSIDWPKRSCFIGMGVGAVESIVSTVFPQDNFNWNIFSRRIAAIVGVPRVSHISHDGTIHATVLAEATCNVNLHLPLPWPLNHTLVLGQLSLRPIVVGNHLKIVVEK